MFFTIAGLPPPDPSRERVSSAPESEVRPVGHQLRLTMPAQPDDSTCGPTCLHAVYGYWNDPYPLRQTIDEIGGLASGGTLAVQLACHALARGYEATIYTYNLHVFDPTWFGPRARGASPVDLAAKLEAQRERRKDLKLSIATEGYLEFLALGGSVQMEPLDERLILRSLRAGRPLLAGLSATYLYREAREQPLPHVPGQPSSVPDDVGGQPVGHFVILCGYDPRRRLVRVADPLWPNPLATDHYYDAPLTRVTAAVHLGILTYDANLLEIRPRGSGGTR